MVTGANQVKGLTTAAALWVTAALGIMIGTGFYFGAVAGTVVVCGFSKALHPVRYGDHRKFPLYEAVRGGGATSRCSSSCWIISPGRGIRVKNLTRVSE